MCTVEAWGRRLGLKPDHYLCLLLQSGHNNTKAPAVKYSTWENGTKHAVIAHSSSQRKQNSESCSPGSPVRH